MTDEEYQIRRKYENRNLMQELEWVSHYPPSGMSNQDRAFIRWLAMTAYDKINELEQTSVPVHDMELILHEVAKPQWISVKERLPEEPYGCLAVVWDNPRYDGDMFLNYYPEFVGWDGETWNDADGEEIPLDVVYWMKMPQIPEPPKEGE